MMFWPITEKTNKQVPSLRALTRISLPLAASLAETTSGLDEVTENYIFVSGETNTLPCLSIR